jgi:signal transduction histidine kinase
VLGLLSLVRSRDAMQAQIEQSVELAVKTTAGGMDDLLRERARNATTWNHVEVMQDLRLGDVDKRLSAFLAEMQRRYGGMYSALHATDRSGRVIASSQPAAIGRTRPAAAQAWLELTLPGGIVRIDAPDPVRADRTLTLRAGIDSAFGEGEIGALLLDVDWTEIERLLDHAAAGDARQVVVVDRTGHVVSASANLRARGQDFGAAFPEGIDGPPIERRDGGPLMPGALIVGRSRNEISKWTTLMLQSRDVALAPVRRMTVVFAGLLAATVLATVVASLWVSGLIARPVLALTRFTRDYLQPGPPPLPPSEGPGEIGELGRSFVNLVEALEHSQGTLVQASRLAALGEVTALMAHEVRTPVGILRSSAQMLRNEPALSGESRELLDIVLGETERLNRLVASMLDQTRTRAPQMQRTDLHALMRQAVALLAAQSRERGVTVSLDCAASDAVIEADPEQLVQVLLNLIGNALQILPRDGRVLLRTQLDDGRLSCDVDDDGPGIAPIDRQRLFEPFVHRREGGFGLGLAIVRQIMRAHGGDAVAIDGSALGGARIRLWLPRTHRPQ